MPKMQQGVKNHFIPLTLNYDYTFPNSKNWITITFSQTGNLIKRTKKIKGTRHQIFKL